MSCAFSSFPPNSLPFISSNFFNIVLVFLLQLSIYIFFIFVTVIFFIVFPTSFLFQPLYFLFALSLSLCLSVSVSVSLSLSLAFSFRFLSTTILSLHLLFRLALLSYLPLSEILAFQHFSNIFLTFIRRYLKLYLCFFLFQRNCVMFPLFYQVVYCRPSIGIKIIDSASWRGIAWLASWYAFVW